MRAFKEQKSRFKWHIEETKTPGLIREHEQSHLLHR